MRDWKLECTRRTESDVLKTFIQRNVREEKTESGKSNENAYKKKKARKVCEPCLQHSGNATWIDARLRWSMAGNEEKPNMHETKKTKEARDLEQEKIVRKKRKLAARRANQNDTKAQTPRAKRDWEPRTTNQQWYTDRKKQKKANKRKTNGNVVQQKDQKPWEGKESKSASRFWIESSSQVRRAIRLLLSAGADFSRNNAEGKTPLMEIPVGFFSAVFQRRSWDFEEEKERSRSFIIQFRAHKVDWKWKREEKKYCNNRKRWGYAKSVLLRCVASRCSCYYFKMCFFLFSRNRSDEGRQARKKREKW